jgi:hypothetical protein
MPKNDISCPICRQPIDLNNFKTDEYGLAVHDYCIVLKAQWFPRVLPSRN